MKLLQTIYSIKNKIYFFAEKVLSNPQRFEWTLPIFFLPVSFIYCLFVFINSFIKFLNKQKLHDNIVGVGNLVLGGSGKTPIILALVEKEIKNNKRIGILLRGYGRQSKGTIIISDNGNIKTSVNISGDEAMLYSQKFKNKNVSVVVSENRKNGINVLQKLKTDIIFLDDSFRQHDIIKNIEYLIKSDNKNKFCIPAGSYREKLWFFKKNENIKYIIEDIDFVRKVFIENKKEKMVLVTAISKPERLYKYINHDIPKYIFPDHYVFNKHELINILKKENADSILVTEKDFVKIKEFEISVSLIKLEIEFIAGGEFDRRRI